MLERKCSEIISTEKIVFHYSRVLFSVYFLPHTSKEHYDKLNNLLIHSFNKYLLSMSLGKKSRKTTFHSLKEINNYRTSANVINQDYAGWNASSERQTYFRDRSEKISLNSQRSTRVLKNEVTFSRRSGRRASWRERRVCVDAKGGDGDRHWGKEQSVYYALHSLGCLYLA